MNPAWSWALAAAGLTGLWLAGTQKAIGWAIGAAAQLLWLAYALSTGQHGFLATAAAYLFVYTRNFRRTRIVSTADHPRMIKIPRLVSRLSEEEQRKLPAAIIVDLDGTLSLRTTRKPMDESPGAVLSDVPCRAVLAVIHAFRDRGHEIIFTSGRRDSCRADTVTWLDRELPQYPGDIIPYELYMRRYGDTRSDVEVKLDMYRDHIFDRFRVDAVFDDRTKVVHLWRALGLTCFQAADGDF